MDAYTALFGDLFAEELGRSLMEYFESKEFPQWLLRDSTLNTFYLRVRIHKILSDQSLPGVVSDALIGAAFDSYYERGGKPLPISEKAFRHKFVRRRG